MTFFEGSLHGCSNHFQYAIQDDMLGGLLPDDFSDSSCDGKYFLYESSVGVLESRNLEMTPQCDSLGEFQPGDQRRSSFKQFLDSRVDIFSNNVDVASKQVENIKRYGRQTFARSVSFAEDVTRHRSATFVRNIDFAQEQAEMLTRSSADFSKRRSTTFLGNIDYAQQQAELLSRSGVDMVTKNVDLAQEQAEDFARSSVSTLASSVDLAQEQMETATRRLGDSITGSIDFAQEQAEMFTRFLASNVFGGAVPGETIIEESMRETCERLSVKNFVEARVDTFTRNIDFVGQTKVETLAKQVEGALLRPQ